MAEELRFEDFLFDVHPAYQAFVVRMDEVLWGRGCKRRMQMAKNGYVISYERPGSKRVLMNYVFRKKGLHVRVYGERAHRDPAVVGALTPDMAGRVMKAANCKRLIDPGACSPVCAMGYTFELNGELQKKCRYGCFLFPVDEDSMPAIEALIMGELNADPQPA